MRSPHIRGMAQINLTDEEWAELRRALRDAIQADKYPLSPRVQALKRVMAKLDPDAAPRPRPEPVAPRQVSDLELMLRASVAGEDGVRQSASAKSGTRRARQAR